MSDDKRPNAEDISIPSSVTTDSIRVNIEGAVPIGELEDLIDELDRVVQSNGHTQAYRVAHAKCKMRIEMLIEEYGDG